MHMEDEIRHCLTFWVGENSCIGGIYLDAVSTNMGKCSKPTDTSFSSYTVQRSKI